MIKTILKMVYRYIKSIILKRRGIFVSSFTYFNHKTIFEGCNVVHKGACISSTYIGYGTYIGSNTLLSNAKIGRYCSIASNVKVITATHPTKDFVSTSPMFFSTLKQTGKTYCTTNKFNESLLIEGRSVIIGNDVWIGDGVTIKGGLKIGDGAVVAMNACVTKDVPPYAIVGGVPAKILRFRFKENEIQKLLAIKWWNKSEDWIVTHAEKFENIDVFFKDCQNENHSCHNSSCI